jgi:flagellar motility protein MotE (MotC chaperone)
MNKSELYKLCKEQQESIKTLQDEVKDKQKWLDEWHKMMRECDKANDFPFGIQDEELNPEKLDDMAHLPAHIKKLQEENQELKNTIKEQNDVMEKILDVIKSKVKGTFYDDEILPILYDDEE